MGTFIQKRSNRLISGAQAKDEVSGIRLTKAGHQVEVAKNGKEEIDCMEELTLEHKQIWVQGLLMECPMGKSLEDCPAKDLRSLPIDERLKLVFDMEEGQIDWIIAHHRECLRKREGKRPGPDR